MSEEILKRLTIVEEAIKHHQKVVEDLLKKHNATLYGNGQSGLTTRIDRIEQTEQGRDFMRRTGAVAVAGLLIKAAWELLVGKP